MRIVALDSVTLIHAFKELLSGVSYPDREREMSGRANILIQSLDIEGATIVVPTVVVAEYLTGIEPEHHDATMNTFRESFETPPFDLKAAMISAKLWRAHRGLTASDQLARNVLKSDVLIIATAKAFGVTHYYSDDKGSRRLAEQAGLVAYDLPERSPYLIPDAVTPVRPKKSPPPKP